MKPSLVAKIKKKEQSDGRLIEVELTFEQVRKLQLAGKDVSIQNAHGFTKVLDSYVKFGPGYEIGFDDGSFVRCARQHRFLVSSNYTGVWRTADEVGFNDIFLGVGGDYKRMKYKKGIDPQEWIDFTVEHEDESYVQNGIIHHNSGKSYSIYLLSRYLIDRDKRVLLVVPSVSLVTQMYTDFMKYNWDYDELPAKIYSGQDKYQDKMMTITTFQSVAKLDADYFTRFDAVIVDECHMSTSVSIKSILSKCRNAEYKIGFTGTLHEHETDQMTTFGYLGPIVYELKTKELIEAKHVSDLKIVNTFVRYPDEDIEKNRHRNYQGEVDFINEDTRRFKVLDTVVNVASENDENILILCTNKEPLEKVRQYLEWKFGDSFTVKVYHGDVKADEREEIRESMEVTSRCILLGTYGCLSTGVSIKRLHHVVLFSSYRSKIKVLQTIGRGLRLHGTKKTMLVWDVIDDLSRVTRTGSIEYNHVMSHWVNDRMRYYKEQGFPTVKYVLKL